MDCNYRNTEIHAWRVPHIIALCLLAVCLLCHLSAGAQKPADVPNPNVADRSQYVADPAGLLSASSRAAVNRMLAGVRAQTTAEVAVAVIPEIGDDTDIDSYAVDLFTEWGLGKDDKDNGVLILFALDHRMAKILTGYGAEGALTDYACKRIIERDIVPAMKRGDLDAAVSGAAESVSRVLTDPAYAEELRSSKPDNVSGVARRSEISAETIMSFAAIVCLIFFCMTAVVFFSALVRSRREHTNYGKSLFWRSRMTSLWVLSLLSGLTAVIFPLLGLFLSRRYRRKPLKCDTCGHKMRRLSEEEDNLLLDPSQDFEENLKTVDYDVWECPQCGTIERLPYVEKQTRYTRCPSCGTIAMKLRCDKTVVPATVSRAGEGEKIYECEFCHHKKRVPYVIPKRESAAPYVAAGILGSMGRGGHGGGGGFGGGFGGGSTGGGGASGGW